MKLKRALIYSKVAHRAFCERTMLRQKIKLRLEERKAAKIGVRLHSVKNLKSNKTEDQNACHIIGSGWSLADSIELARKNNAYTIGFNFACLSGLEFDAYFVEFGGSNCADIAKKQKDSLCAFERNISGHLLFKNLWEEKNEIGYAAQLYGDRVKFIRDIAIPCFHERHLDMAASLYLKPDWQYLRQYRSSALTAINFARYLGFRKIVLHGIDFGGGYFFDLPDFSHVGELTPPLSNNLAYNKDMRTGRHPTAGSLTGIEKILPFVRESLEESSTYIYSASVLSPLSKIIPVFEGIR